MIVHTHISLDISVIIHKSISNKAYTGHVSIFKIGRGYIRGMGITPHLFGSQLVDIKMCYTSSAFHRNEPFVVDIPVTSAYCGVINTKNGNP